MRLVLRIAGMCLRSCVCASVYACVCVSFFWADVHKHIKSLLCKVLTSVVGPVFVVILLM